MSVVKGKRTPTDSKLETAERFKMLCNYTLTICKNEKHFPKRNRWLLTAPIVKASVDAFAYVRRANAVEVVAYRDYELRREYQIKAKTEIEVLLGLIEIAYATLGTLDGDQVEYWTAVAEGAAAILSRWRDADRRRYKAMLEAKGQWKKDDNA